MQTNYSPPPTAPMEISPQDEIEALEKELEIARQVRDRLQNRVEACYRDIANLCELHPDNIPLQKVKAIVENQFFDDEF